MDSIFLIQERRTIFDRPSESLTGRSNARLSLPGISSLRALLLNKCLYLLFCMASVLQHNLQRTNLEAINFIQFSLKILTTWT